jgi:hypothetical protein
MQSTTAHQRLSGHYASVQHDANLVLSALRHQRDLFSGGPSLGIPDVNTHVGSVIHAFENLAYQRQMKEGEKPYESSKSTSSAGKKESIYKIILPPPPKTSTGTLTDPPKQIVRHRPKGKAPDVPTSSATNTASATTQTTKFSGDENESSALDSLNLEDDYRRNTSNHNKFPQSYVKNYKVLPPFVVPPPPRQPSRIPTKTVNKVTNQQSARNNRMSDSLLLSKARTDVFLRPTKYTEDDIENDFLRGTTVSQSFIKNVVRKSPTRKISTYEQNFLMNSDNNETTANKVKRKSVRDQKSRSKTTTKLEQPLIDEVSMRYKEYGSGSNNDVSSLRNKHTRQQNFQPRSVDRAEL